MKKFKPMKCYYCGKMIESYSDHVNKEIPMQKNGKTVFKMRDLHLTCLPKITENVVVGTDEMIRGGSDWDKCYDKMKEFLDIPDGRKLPQFAVMRLLGLRVGKFTPRSENVIFRNVGYEFDTIYKTMVLVTAKIKHAKKTVKFEDANHQINYFMTIITASIDYMTSMIEKKKNLDKRFEREQKKQEELQQVEQVIENEIFITEEERERDKLATEKLLEDLRRQEEEESEFDDLFL